MTESAEKATAAADSADGNVSVTHGQGKALKASGASVEVSRPCGPSLTRADLDAGIDLGGRYLLAAQRPNGDFVYEVDWTTGDESIEDNPVRQAGATWGMSLLYRETRNPEYRIALDHSLARWMAEAHVADGRLWFGERGARSGKLGTVALIG